MARVTRRDIAREAGVSETIVSYVVNGNRYVDAAKRERVLEAVDKLGWKPNPMARALRGKHSDHILFIADDMTSEHFGTIIAEMERCASAEGIMISLTADRGDPSFVSRVTDWNFDGIVIGSATLSDGDIQTLIDTGTPVVLLEINAYPDFRGSYGIINTGLMQGARAAVIWQKTIIMMCLRFPDE